MRKLNLVLSIGLIMGTVLAVSCGGGAAPTATVTVTKTAPSSPGAAPTVTMTTTVTTTAPAVTVIVPPTPTPTKLVKVKNVAAAGGASVIFMTLGKERGIFEKRGIDLVVEEATTAIAKMAAFTGQADIGDGDVIQFYPERTDVRVIGGYFSIHFGLLVRKDSPYRSYRDLVGKKIATPGVATASHWVAKTIARMEGVDLEKDMQVLYGDATVQIGWLLKGEVEAIHSWEPFISKLLVTDGDKVKELYWQNDAYKRYSRSSWPLNIFASDAWVKQNSELARQVGLAYDDLLRYMSANDQVWKSDTVKKVWKIDDPAVLEIVAQRLPRILETPPYGPAFKSALIKKSQFLADAGVVPKDAVDWTKGSILFAEPW